MSAVDVERRWAAPPERRRRHGLGPDVRLWRRIQNVDWWLLLVTAALCTLGVMTIQSATLEDGEFSGHALKQAVYLMIGGLVALGLFLVPIGRIHQATWWLYALLLASLMLLPVFGSELNGARRWYRLFGLSVQPSEFAKLAVVLGLARWFRFRDSLGEAGERATSGAALVGALLLTAVPALLVFKQPDLGSSLVFWPILFAVAYAGGVPARRLGILALTGAALAVVAWFTILHDYQKGRVSVWLQHFFWDEQALERSEVQAMLRGDAYQPWQALIAVGSGGRYGFGYEQGPQSQFDFLPYRDGDYVFAVVAEELGFVGAVLALGLVLAQVLLLLAAADRTRERFGRMVLVGVAAWIASQTLMHVAVCTWLVPATGLPMPFVSHGASSAVALLLAVGVCANVGSRRSQVLAGDGYRMD